MTIEFLGYALPGLIVLLLGVAWTWAYAAPRGSPASPHCCPSVAARHPVQGLVKLGVSLVGIVASLFAAYPGGAFQYVGEVHFASVYLLFALSGLVDVLACYCPHTVGRGPARLALSLAFLVEALVFFDLSDEQEQDGVQRCALALLIAVMAACGLLTALAGAFPGAEAARCLATLVHGSWFCHCGALLHWPSTVPAMEPGRSRLWVSLAFSWHCAADLSLIIVLLFVRRLRVVTGHERERTGTSLTTPTERVSSPLHLCACPLPYHRPFSTFSTVSTA